MAIRHSCSVARALVVLGGGGRARQLKATWKPPPPPPPTLLHTPIDQYSVTWLQRNWKMKVLRKSHVFLKFSGSVIEEEGEKKDTGERFEVSLPEVKSAL